MHENETIEEIVSRFTKINNGLSFLGDRIDNYQKMRKVIELFPKLGRSMQQLSKS